MWFSFDGESFETHGTEAEAKETAEQAMQLWSDRAAGNVWDDVSDQVCYGKITHAVRVEHIEVTEENRHLVPTGCDAAENHHLEPVNGCLGKSFSAMDECPDCHNEQSDCQRCDGLGKILPR